MAMFSNKREVDRHVSQMTQKLSESERSSRGYLISKLYAKVREYEVARDWLQRYLDIKTEDAVAHKYMGEIYEQLGKMEQAITSYQRSFNLNSKQNDLIKNICRLFLVDDGWTSSPGKAKYWCELADTENVRDDNVLSLRLKMLNKDKKGGGKPVEEMILKEIAARPHDISLRIRLVKFLLEEKRVVEAFKYCFDLEMKFMETFLLSIEWYTTVSSVLSQHTPDSWNYWCLLLISFDKRIFLTLKKELVLQTIKQTSIKEVTNLIYEFDQVLKKAADSLLILAPVKELAEEIINHFRGQMALNIASLLFQKQKVSNTDSWRDVTRKCLPFLLFAFQSSTADTDAYWLKNTNDVIRGLFAYFKKEGAFRCVQAGRTILACKLNGRKTIDDIFNLSRETCVDLNWRKNIYRQLFSNVDKLSTSYFAQNTFFQEPRYDIISFSDLEGLEDVAQHLFPSSLEHHIYLGLGRKDLHTYKSHTFSGLNLSTSNLINCSPETINRIDIDSFLYCSVIQAKRRLEAERDCFESFSSKPCEKPLILPAANMVEGLCIDEQSEWWLSAFKIYKNISGENLAQLKATLQFGIEAVRGIDTVKIDTIILLKLGEILLATGEKPEERRHFELRAEYVYKQAMRQMKSRDTDNARRLFKFATSNFDVEQEVEQLAGTAISHLAGIYFKREEFKEFIEDFAGVQNPWALFYRAEAYKKLDVAGKSKKLFAEKARENLVESLALLDGSEKDHPLRSRVEKDLKKMQYNFSASFNEDSDFHNASNGHVDEEVFHNASSTSFRGRRDASMTVNQPNYNEKFLEVENLIRKLNDLVVSVKDDVLCVRNDITDLKDELLNIRGDIADFSVKKDPDVYKAIEDLTWNVTYMMSMMQGPARIPQNPMMNQMYNTAYPMYPQQMQYPPPSMMQRPPQPQPQIPAYDPMAMQPTPSALLEALNTPSLLNTWNNTYKPVTTPMTPPVLSQPQATLTQPQQVVAPQPTAPIPTPVIQNKPVEKAPPANVVIKSSDPLPSLNTVVPQPILPPVTIPKEHIKHPPKQPQYENISPAKNDTSEYLVEPADYDPRPDFKPIIPLPDEIEVKPDEENEDIMFKERCKLFRHVNGEWKERGIGNIKILKNKDTGKCRILMRREQIHKVCANHVITSEMDLKPTMKENQMMWVANDFSEDEMTTEKFLVRFKTAEMAGRFKEAFEAAKKSTPKTPSAKEPLKVKDDNTKVTKPAAPIFGSPAATTNPPKAPTFSFGGLTGSLTPASSGLFASPIEKPKEKEDKTKTPAQPSPFANFTFGQGSTSKSFSELFSNISSPASSAAPAPAQSTPVENLNKSAHHEDEVEHYEPTAQFEPVIPLPDLVEVKTGEEDENLMFKHRCKLLRYDKDTKEWKERGIGDMKVLVHKTDASKARLLMRREQILKLCCNMTITQDLKFKKMNSNTYSFGGQDFSEAEMRTETLAIKFKTSELVEKFIEAVKNVQKNLGAAPKPVVEEKKPEVKGFGDAFKPKAGSWTCEGCYITNKADDLYCVACDSPKDSTVPKKEAKSLLAAPDAPKFSFGMPATSGFSFGMPPAVEPVAPAETTPAKFSFGVVEPAKPATATAPSFSFGNIAKPVEKPKETAAADSTSSGFSFGAPKSFSFGAVEPAVEKPSDPVIASENFNFVFKKKSPLKAAKSPTGKSRNDSVNSEGGGDEADDDYHEEEENQTYFTPVIPLPEKVEVKTGEENEEVLYSHRAKLFRFADKEWKERGLGDIKVLKHKETGKLRVVMRREQIHKICLNFFLTDEIELLSKDDNSWTFGAADFSEGEIEPTSFAIRFKNKEIAQDFKKAIEDALAGASNSTGEKQDGETDEKSQLVKKLLLPEKFFDYLNAPDCPGCIGCKSDDFVFKKPSAAVEKTPLSNEQPLVKSKPKPRRQSVDRHVSFKFTDEKKSGEDEKVKQLFGAGSSLESSNVFGGGIKKSEATQNIFAAFNAENPAKTSQPASVFNSNSIFSSSLNTTDGNKTAEPFSGGLFGNKTNFTFGSSSVTSSENGSFSATPAFGSSIFGGVKPAATTAPTVPTQNIFGSGLTSTFSFAEAAKTLDKPKENSVPDFIQKSNDSGGFAALAAVEKTWATPASSATGGFYGLTVKDDFFSKNLKGANADGETSHNDDSGANDENYDPHYDPIISLPDEIKVSTGEEDEEKIFAERAKLYRYDTKTKEWKERGVGELKILHHLTNGTYRLLLRREQIFKLVLNQLISSEFHMSPMNNSPKAFCWAGMNYAEGAGEAEQLAIRFKNEDLASGFKAKVDECMEKLESRENLQPEND